MRAVQVTQPPPSTPALTPGDRIRLARENLCLAMALFAASHQGLITTSFVTQSANLYLPNGDVVDAYAPLELSDNAALVRCVGNQIRGSFALSALQTHRELEAAFPGTPGQDDPDADLRVARAAVYLLASAVEQDLIAPVWRVPLEYRRLHTSPTLDFTLDATDLDGQEVRWEHFGGLPHYLDLTLYLAQRLDGVEPGATADTAPAGPYPAGYGPVGALANQPASEVATAGPASIAPGYGSGSGRLRRAGNRVAAAGNRAVGNDADSGWIAPVGRPEPPIGIAPQATEDGPVAAFVINACFTGGKAMTLASDLYTCYASWCLDNGYLAVSQRKFGLELTAGGYQRKRRGKGRHWWMGLEPRQ